MRRFGSILALVAALVSPADAGAEAAVPAATGWRAVTVAEGIRHPWAITWLPDGRALITGKQGTLHLLDGAKLAPVALEGLPELFASGQGGLMDVALHPKDRENPRVYFTMSSGDARENRTILVRGRFDGAAVKDVRTLFRVEPAKSGAAHFGSRLLWLPDGTLLMSVGDGGNPPTRIGDRLAREQAQNLETHQGSILRLTEDGRPAAGNPFADRKGAAPEIWSYGHRNVQGLVRDPASGRIWATEHGPRGGDELNLLEPGENYGWPEQTAGLDYRTGEPVGEPSVAGIPDPKLVWSPSIAPSGLAVVSSDRFPEWRGSLLGGGLASGDVRRIVLDEKGTVVREERLPIGRRVRDVRQGPDGFPYVLTDETNGRVLRLEPEPR